MTTLVELRTRTKGALGITGSSGERGFTDPQLDQHLVEAIAEFSLYVPAQASAELTLDLGAVVPISRVTWVFEEAGFASAMTVEVSGDGVGWAPLGTFGNAAAGVWQEVPVGGSARFVRFAFANRDGSPRLDGLGEVAVWP